MKNNWRRCKKFLSLIRASAFEKILALCEILKQALYYSLLIRIFALCKGMYEG